MFHLDLKLLPTKCPRCKESPRRRSPSPGPRTEALVQNFTQLGGGGSSNNISKNNSCDVGFKDVLRPAQTWRRSLPDCSRISTENKENSAQFNFSRSNISFRYLSLKIILDLCRSNDFLPIRPPSPLHSSYPRPVARVAPGGFTLHEISMKNLTNSSCNILFYFSVECRR